MNNYLTTYLLIFIHPSTNYLHHHYLKSTTFLVIYFFVHVITNPTLYLNILELDRYLILLVKLQNLCTTKHTILVFDLFIILK